MSPTFLSQRVTVPSVTDSPSAGIVTTTPAEDACVGAGAVATGAGAEGVGVTGGGVGAATGAAATGAGVVAGADAPSAITANSAPTATVESTGTTIFVSVPETGEGISVSTLSVETSRRGSSTLT